ncbi:hypothetical protein E2P81_ATG01927 [Venturia nashicola]|uniref:Uncharacterized protein n=1 Tax=Venturia nashicola TaxID=86259 RepID=A0A4Z1P487_9PEZI|nr:hypothetical protein E6O75_ATG01969 [Venturia nashicola]TLD35624.1 hypothetical protein E2P81_ATG01927 [Venturia nashicola]
MILPDKAASPAPVQWEEAISALVFELLPGPFSQHSGNTAGWWMDLRTRPGDLRLIHIVLEHTALSAYHVHSLTYFPVDVNSYLSASPAAHS